MKISRTLVRRLRNIVTVAGLFVLLFAAPAATQRPAYLAAPVGIEIKAEPLAGFAVRDSSLRRFGALQFRGGLVLTSAHREFGGISSIAMDPDGSRFLAVTDRGNWLRGQIQYSGNAPVAIANAELAPILGPDGKSIRTRRWYDSEAVAREGGDVYVSIERVHQILWFDYAKDGLLAPGRQMRVPPEFRRLPSNKGIEGLAVAPKGTPLAGALIAVSERSLDAAGNIRAFLIGGPHPGIFTIKRSNDFDITDIALLPDHDLLVLERHFSLTRGANMRIRRLSMNALKPGALVDGPVLIEADWGYQIDNMEGLGVHRSATGETVLTVVSDDNFSSIQRTLLLQFTLIPP